MRVLLRGYKDPLVAVDPVSVLDQGMLGGNSGNLIFSESSYRALATSTSQITLSDVHGRWLDADRVNEEQDAVVLPFANAFRPEFVPALKRYTAFIRRLRVPVTVLGIGAQSDVDYRLGPLDPIAGPVKAFVSAVLDKSPSIGVRGEFSHDYLRGLGFSAVTTIGCPSMFTGGRALAPQHAGGALGAESPVAINLTPGVEHPGLLDRHLERYPRLVYVPQSQAELRMMLWGIPAHVSEGGSDYPSTLAHPVFAEDRARYYVDATTWIRAMREVDFTFGSRIHGNIAALLGGGRAHVLVHDSRTRELSEYFEIPHTLVRDLAPDVDAADLYERSDPVEVHRGHATRFDVFTSFLDEHRIEHTLTGAAPAPVDETIRSAGLPGPVRSPTSAEQLLLRARWTHEHHRARLGALEERVRRLERRTPRPDDGEPPPSPSPDPDPDPRSPMKSPLRARLVRRRAR